MKTVYTASKVRHAAKWRQMREEWPCKVISTWIDEADEGQTWCFIDLWTRCVREASEADCLLVYCEPGDQLKGGLVEVGAALAAGKPVYTVGPMDGSWVHHPLVTPCKSLMDVYEKLFGVAYEDLQGGVQ